MACSPPGTELPVNEREFCEIFKFSQQAQRENLLSTGRLYGLYTYVYDGAGRRIEAVDGFSTRRFLKMAGAGGTMENPQAITDADSNLLHSYVYAGDQPLQRIDASGTRYYLTDAMGSVIGVTDEAGNLVGSVKYDAFGGEVEQTGDMSLPASAGGDFRFHGQWLEAATGLYYMRARDYDPVTGRFLSPDPAEPNRREPESLNRYLFANANPYQFSDPSGRFTMVSVNISVNIQSTLSSIAINIARDYLIDKARSVAGSIALSALRNFTALQGFNPWGAANDVREVGRVWEGKVQEFICGLFPGVMREVVWFEPTVFNGLASSNGYGCPGGGSGGFAPRGSSKPDFMLSKTPPSELGKTPKKTIKAYLIGETKWRLKTFYNAYVLRRNINQLSQIAAFAQKRVYARTAVFLALLNGTTNSQERELTVLLSRTAATKKIIPVMVSAQ